MLFPKFQHLGKAVSSRRLHITVIVTTAAAAGAMSSAHTPIPSGSYKVGCSDIMVGKTKEGSLMRIFYPARDVTLDDTSNWTKWYIGEEYTKGLASFIAPSIPSIFNMIFNWKMRGALVPAIWNAPIIEGKLPVVVFSHGLSASRTLYSSVCSDLASHGFFVAAIEHRDTSACASFTFNESGDPEWIPFKTILQGEKEFDIRQKQVNIRVAECGRALDILELLNSRTATNELDSKFDLATLHQKLDFSKVIMAGHSFGGATTIYSMAKDHRFKIGVALDPWMFPLKEDIDDISESIDQPLICINTEAFQSESNMEALKKLEGNNTVFVTIKGTVHQNQCDTPFLAGPIGRVVAGASSTLDYNTAMELNNKLALHFICKHLGKSQEVMNQLEYFLEENKHLAIYGLFPSAKRMRVLNP